MARVKADLRRSVLQSARSNRRQAQDRKRGHYIGTINKVLLKRALLMVISGTELEGVGGSWKESLQLPPTPSNSFQLLPTPSH